MLVSESRVAVTSGGRLLTTGRFAGLWRPRATPGRFKQVDGPATLVFDVENDRAARWFAPSGTTAFDRAGPIRQTATLGILAALTAIAAIATLVGTFTRDRREFRQTSTQARAGLVQTTVAVLWLIAMIAFGAWAAGATDLGRVMYSWPGAPLLSASACALVAALLTMLTLFMAPMVWRGGRRVDSWTVWRKLRFTVSTLVYSAFSFVLLVWGPWSPGSSIASRLAR